MSTDPGAGDGPPQQPDGLFDWARPANERRDPPAQQEPLLPATHSQPATRSIGLRLAAALVGIAAVAGGLVSGATVAFLNSGESPAVPKSSGQAASSLSVEQTSATSDVAVRARPGIVRIESTKRTNGGVEQDVGSGVILDTDGHIATNAHVVLGTDSLKVFLSDGTERPAILLGHDFPFTDVAVLQISPGKLTPIEAGDSSVLKLGETVIAIGNPLAEFDGSVTVGVVSGVGRSRIFDGVRQDDLLQTDAAVNNGNSGGALLNLSGQFIGMPTAVLRQARTGQSVEGIAFALPSNRVMEIARTIIQSGTSYPRPSLGLEHLDLTPDVLSRLPRLGSTEGAIVTGVTAGGPAESAGIQIGDVITKVGDHDVTRADPFLNALVDLQPGQTARVVLNRNGRIIEAEVRLARRS